MTGLTDDQLLRYSRQIMLPEVDVAGQESLVAGTALIIGMGGLGAPAAVYLASAGVGQLVIVDHDRVEASNLQRQIVHHDATIGQTKVASARQSLLQTNPETRITAIDHKLESDELLRTVAGADVVLDATDNFAARFAVNAACWEAGVPLVSGAAIRWEGQVAVFDPRDAESPCYQCLYAEGQDETLNCAENGVIAPLVGIIGTCQAMEAIKLLTGVGETLTGRVLYFDAKRMDWRKLKLPKDPACPNCSA